MFLRKLKPQKDALQIHTEREEREEFFQKFYMEQGRVLAETWRTVSRETCGDLLPELRRMIEWEAKHCWGPNAFVEFDEANLTVTFKHPDGRSIFVERDAGPEGAA